MIDFRNRCRSAMGILLLVVGGFSGPANAATDLGKKACVQEEKRLCPAAMKSMSRKKVETCMITKIAETSPVCHAAMLKIKAQREAAIKR